MATRKVMTSKRHRRSALQLVMLLMVLGEAFGQAQFGELTSPVPRLGGFGNEVPAGDCGNRDIAQCVELLEVLTSKDIGFAASREELNNMCPVLLSGLQCIDNYTLRCLSPQHRSYFNKLYNGTMLVIRDLCTSRGGRYQQEYIRHAPCMRQVNPKYNRCSEVYHRKTAGLNQAVVRLSERDKARNVITLCCSFQEYLQCSERVVYESCGNETALFTKNFLNRMAGPIVQDICILINFRASDCFPPAPRRTSGHRPPLLPQPVSESVENTLGRPYISRHGGASRPVSNNDRRMLQHYNSFSTPSPTVPAPARKTSDRFLPPLQFVGVRNGTRIYRRFRRPNSRFSTGPTPPVHLRYPANQYQRVDSTSLDEEDSQGIVWIRSLDGKRLVKLRRGPRVMRPTNPYIHRTRPLPNTSPRRDTSGGTERLGLEPYGGNTRQTPAVPFDKRHHRSQTFPFIRRSRTRMRRKLSEGEGKMLEKTTNTSKLGMNSTVSSSIAETVGTKQVLKRRRRLRRRKRLHGFLYRRRRKRPRGMLQTLLDKLIHDAERYSYKTRGEKSNETIGILPRNTSLLENSTDMFSKSEDETDYEREIVDEVTILTNSSLSDNEKFLALLRLKMMASLQEAVISIGHSDASKHHSSTSWSSSIDSPVLIDFVDTDFISPLPFNLTSFFTDDIVLNITELDEIWLFNNSFNDTLFHANETSSYEINSNRINAAFPPSSSTSDLVVESMTIFPTMSPIFKPSVSPQDNSSDLLSLDTNSTIMDSDNIFRVSSEVDLFDNNSTAFKELDQTEIGKINLTGGLAVANESPLNSVADMSSEDESLENSGPSDRFNESVIDQIDSISETSNVSPTPPDLLDSATRVSTENILDTESISDTSRTHGRFVSITNVSQCSEHNYTANCRWSSQSNRSHETENTTKDNLDGKIFEPTSPAKENAGQSSEFPGGISDDEKEDGKLTFQEILKEIDKDDQVTLQEILKEIDNDTLLFNALEGNENTGNLKNLPMPLVTLVLSLHMLM